MKQLQGKAREDFEKWLKEHHKVADYNEYREIDGYSTWIADYFDDFPQSAQFGLIQEWGDSVGEKISIYWREIDDDWFAYIGIVSVSELFFKSLPEAQIKAVEKLNEIINQLKDK